MTNVTTVYVKRLFWLATIPYLIGGAIFLTGAADFTEKEAPIKEEVIALEKEFAKAPEVKSSDPFLGEVIMFAGNFAPRGWAFCNGQVLAISQNQALFSLLGTTYGGDGRTTFALPDLRGRAAVHSGSGPGLTTRRLGAKFGAESLSFQDGRSAVSLSESASTNRKVPNIVQPSLAINYIIALQGTYPSRN